MKGHLCILEIPSNLEFGIVVFQWSSTPVTSEDQGLPEYVQKL